MEEYVIFTSARECLTVDSNVSVVDAVLHPLMLDRQVFTFASSNTISNPYLKEPITLKEYKYKVSFKDVLNKFEVINKSLKKYLMYWLLQDIPLERNAEEFAEEDDPACKLLNAYTKYQMDLEPESMKEFIVASKAYLSKYRYSMSLVHINNVKYIEYLNSIIANSSNITLYNSWRYGVMISTTHSKESENAIGFSFDEEEIIYKVGDTVIDPVSVVFPDTHIYYAFEFYIHISNSFTSYFRAV